MQALLSIVRAEGVKGLFVGGNEQLIREIPFNAIQFTVYEVCVLMSDSYLPRIRFVSVFLLGRPPTNYGKSPSLPGARVLYGKAVLNVTLLPLSTLCSLDVLFSTSMPNNANLLPFPRLYPLMLCLLVCNLSA